MDNLCHKTAAVSTIWLHHKNAFWSKSSYNSGRPFCRLSMRKNHVFTITTWPNISAHFWEIHTGTHQHPYPSQNKLSLFLLSPIYLPYTGPHIQTDLAKHTIKGCKVLFPVNIPLGLERHLWKCRLEWGENQLYEQI